MTLLQKVFIGLFTLAIVFGWWLGKSAWYRDIQENWEVGSTLSRSDRKLFVDRILPEIMRYKLSPTQYAIARDELRAVVAERDPGAALDALAARVGRGDIRRDCNNLTYEIGDAGYRRYAALDAALRYRRQLCGDGYYHGVLGAFFETLSGDLAAGFRKTCDAFSPGKDRQECYHQSGHSLRLRLGGVDQALAGCDTYADDLTRMACGLGVFHEHFSPHQGTDHASEPTDHNPMQLCSEVKPLYQSTCAQLAPRLFIAERGAGGVLSWCRSAAAPLDQWCVRGAVWDLTQYTYDFSDMEYFCLSGTQAQIAPCMAELVRQTAALHTRKEIEDMCTGLKYGVARDLCLELAAVEPRINNPPRVPAYGP